MLEAIILGIVQGIFEWLPVSSEGLIVIIKANFFGELDIENIVQMALFLHLGTFLAAFFYFWKDIKQLTSALFTYKRIEEETRKILLFLLIGTIITGVFGIVLLKTFIIYVEGNFEATSAAINLIVGILLLITGFIQLRTGKKEGQKQEKELKISDSVTLGFVQAFAVLPGLSRSGLTISALLLKKFNKTLSLRLSFLMSLPVVLFGNVFLNFELFSFSIDFFIGLIASFLLGFATIHWLIKISQKINFGNFVIGFGILMIIAGIIFI
jgi:undecaprenyl-diphosphatase